MPSLSIAIYSLINYVSKCLMSSILQHIILSNILIFTNVSGEQFCIAVLICISLIMNAAASFYTFQNHLYFFMHSLFMYHAQFLTELLTAFLMILWFLYLLRNLIICDRWENIFQFDIYLFT